MLANLKALRHSQKITQEEMAKKLEVKIKSYQNWEQQRSAPPLQTIIKLADFFEVSIDTLVGTRFADSSLEGIDIIKDDNSEIVEI